MLIKECVLKNYFYFIFIFLRFKAITSTKLDNRHKIMNMLLMYTVPPYFIKAVVVSCIVSTQISQNFIIGSSTTQQNQLYWQQWD